MLENQFDPHELETLANHAFSHRFNHTLHAYIDIAGDLVSGTLLSQIIYWFTPNQNGQQKVRVFKDGYYWLAKTQDEWFNEIRISAKQYRTAIKKLEDRNLIIKKRYKFNGYPTTHIRPNYPVLQEETKKWKHAVMKEIEEENMANDPFLTKGKKPVKSSGSGNLKEEKSAKPAELPVFDQRSKSIFTKGQKGNLPKVKNLNRDYNKDYKQNQTNPDCLIDSQDSQIEKEAEQFVTQALKMGTTVKSVQATKTRYLEARGKGIDPEQLLSALKETFERYGKATSPISVIQTAIDNRVAAEEAAKAAMVEAEEKEKRRKQTDERVKAAMANYHPGEVGN